MKKKDLALAPLREIESAAEDKRIESILTTSHLDSSTTLYKAKKAPVFKRDRKGNNDADAEVFCIATFSVIFPLPASPFPCRPTYCAISVYRKLWTKRKR
jgi:hypothetical protein